MGVKRIVGYRQVTDGHLLTLAIRPGGKVATFSGGVSQLLAEDTDPSTVIEIIR